MTVLAATCSACGRATFPPALVCTCGKRAWVDTVLSDGAVEVMTTLRPDADNPTSIAVVMACVQTPEGCTAIARADPWLGVHDRVRLVIEAGAVWARPIPN